MSIGTYKFIKRKRDIAGRFKMRRLSRTQKGAGCFIIGILLFVGIIELGDAFPLYKTLVAGNVHASTLSVTFMEKSEANRPYILKRIAQAESWDSHHCTQAHVRAKLCKPYEVGQVLVRRNPNGTDDIGRYQINTYYWGEAAAELGLNIYDEEHNERMAEWIYDTHGTQPWYLSEHMWR